MRAKHGRFLLYMDTTTKGNSGSPVYTFDITGSKALVVGVHVAGHHVANTAVPIMYYMSTQENPNPEVSATAQDFEIAQSKD